VLTAKLTELGDDDDDVDVDESDSDDSSIDTAKETREALATEVDMRMLRLERLMQRRALLVSSVLLRQNPHNVAEWHKRVALFSGEPVYGSYNADGDGGKKGNGNTRRGQRPTDGDDVVDGDDAAMDVDGDDADEAAAAAAAADDGGERSFDPVRAVATYTEAVTTVDPRKAQGLPHTLWVSFAQVSLHSSS
jgi:hypothetical protein